MGDTRTGRTTDVGGDSQRDVDADAVKKDGDDEYRDIPIDRGWAWMVALGSFMNHFIYSSYFFVVSVLFLDIMNIFEASATLVTILLSLKSIVYCVSTQLQVNLLMPVMSIKNITIIAAASNVLSTLLFVSIPILPVFFVVGLCKSIAQGGAVVPSLTLVGHYFQRRRAFATATSLLGTSLASIAVPPLIRYLREEFGFRGAYLLIAGMEMNALPASMLLRPRTRHVEKATKINPAVSVKKSDVDGNFSEQKSKTLSQNNDSRVDMVNGTENCDERVPMLSKEISDDVRCTQFNEDHGKTLITHVSEEDLQNSVDIAHESPIQIGSGMLEQPGMELEDFNYSPTLNRDKSAPLPSSPITSSDIKLIPLSSLPSTSPDNKPPNRHGISNTADNNSPHQPSIADPDLDIVDPKARLDKERDGLTHTYLMPSVASHASFDVFLSQSQASLNVSTKDNNIRTKLHEDVHDVKRTTEHSKCWIRLRNIFRSLVDLSLLKNYLALLQLASYTMTYACVYISVYLPSHAVKMGVSETRAALLLTIVGVVDVFTRIGFGYFADLNYVRIGRIIAAAALCVGLVCHFSAFYTSYAALVFMSVVCGALAFLPLGLNAPLITDWLGVENLGKMLALGTILSAFSSFIQYPLHGVLIEATGSFSASFHYIGGSYILGALCLLMEPLVRRLQRAKERRKDREKNGQSDR